jgi:hypothetical protein
MVLSSPLRLGVPEIAHRTMSASCISSTSSACIRAALRFSRRAICHIVCVCVCVCVCIILYIYTHTRTHAHTHTRAHTHKHSHTHTHTHFICLLLSGRVAFRIGRIWARGNVKVANLSHERYVAITEIQPFFYQFILRRPSRLRVCVCVCMYIRMYACLYVCMYVCIHVSVSMYVCMHACMYTYTYIHTHIYIIPFPPPPWDRR